MTIGAYTFEIHLTHARSLKDKRQVLRRLKDRLRARHNVAVAEVEDHANLWQRAEVVVVSVSSSRDALVRFFETVRAEVEDLVPGQVIETGNDFIESTDGGHGGWGEEWP